MLTCEQIVAEVKRMSTHVDSFNSDVIAERIFPRTKHYVWPKLSTDDFVSVFCLMKNEVPEWRENKRAALFRSTSQDWTDMVISQVTLWQYEAAVKVWMENNFTLQFLSFSVQVRL